MALIHELTTAQLRQALQLREQIETLQQKLGALLGGSEKPGKAKAAKASGPGKRTMSAEARAKIAAAQQARWAKSKESTATPARAAKPVAAPKKKGGLTPEGRAKLAAAMKARWASRKKGAPAPNASPK